MIHPEDSTEHSTTNTAGEDVLSEEAMKSRNTIPLDLLRYEESYAESAFTASDDPEDENSAVEDDFRQATTEQYIRAISEDKDE
jgi:hypothetical protein